MQILAYFYNLTNDITRAREIAAKFFAQKNGESQHTICAIGNCHIDTGQLSINAKVKIVVQICIQIFMQGVHMYMYFR